MGKYATFIIQRWSKKMKPRIYLDKNQRVKGSDVPGDIKNGRRVTKRALYCMSQMIYGGFSVWITCLFTGHGGSYPTTHRIPEPGAESACDAVDIGWVNGFNVSKYLYDARGNVIGINKQAKKLVDWLINHRVALGIKHLYQPFYGPAKGRELGIVMSTKGHGDHIHVDFVDSPAAKPVFEKVS